MVIEMRTFSDKLNAAYDTCGHFGLLLAPRLAQMPLPMQRFDDPLLPFGKALIDATRDLVCAYVFDLSAYLAPGASGVVALERTIRYAGGSAVTVLHGAFVGVQYSIVLDELSLGVDAVTIAEARDLAAYLTRPDRSAFVIRSGTVDPSAALPTGGIYWQEGGLLQHLGGSGQNIAIQVLQDDVIYAGRGDDFAQATRDAVKRQSS